MKRLLIASLIILAAAITTAQAGSLVTLFAQTGTDTPPVSPAATPAEAPAVKPAEPVPAQPAVQEVKPAEPAPGAKPVEPAPKTEPVAKPGAAEAPKAGGKPSQKQDHGGFTGMALNECAGCHKGEGVTKNHDADWVRGHRILAGMTNKNCAFCHQQSFCLDCHKGGGIDIDLRTEISRASTMPSSHRTDFIEIHPIKAKDNPQTCGRCHAAKFCSECHARFRGEDLQVLSHRRGWSNLQTANPGPAHSTFNTTQCQTCHPNGLLPQHVWSADHSREARRNLQACQTCHSDGQTCMTCHSARTGLRVNPHPRGWDKVKDSYKKRSDGRSCVKCHDNY